jgi:hypothetical protein
MLYPRAKPFSQQLQIVGQVESERGVRGLCILNHNHSRWISTGFMLVALLNNDKYLA